MTDNNADFYEANSRISKIKLMYQKENFQYSENKDLRIQVVHIPYKRNNREIEFVFIVLLPNCDVQFEEVEQKLSTDPQLMQQVLDS
jgi:serine protease inhibitor